MSEMRTAAPDLISRMRTATMPLHEELDALVMKSKPFESEEAYKRLLTMQYLLQRDFEPLYRDGVLAARIPGLGSRSRLHLAEQDMADLGCPSPASPAPATMADDGASRLGWLFVIEGSKLGGASLAVRAAALGMSAEYGARHLHGDPEGPALSWRSFCEAVREMHMLEEDRLHAEMGACAAFGHALFLAEACLASQAPTRAAVHA